MTCNLVHLEEVAEFINGRAFKPSEWSSSGLPIIRIQNLTGSNETFNYFDGPIDERIRVRVGDILISWSASLGVYRWQGNDAALNQHIFKVRLTKGVDSGYFFYAATNALQEMTTRVHGSTMQHITKDRFESIQIKLPNLPEQRRSVEQLEQADRLRRTRRYALEHSGTLLPAAFVKLFGDPIALMRNWPRKPFAELLAIGLQNGLSPSTAGKVTARVLTLSAITRGGFDSSASKLGQFNTEPPKAKRVSVLDFLICRGNGNLGMVGRGEFPLHDMPECVFPDTMIAAQVRSDLICRRFLEAVWKSPAIRKQIEASARTTNGTHKINQEVLEELEIPVPPVPLQKDFASLVERGERLRAAQGEAVRQAEHLFASLLHRAFSG
jgi:type I restriction enzyme S subunit